LDDSELGNRGPLLLERLAADGCEGAQRGLEDRVEHGVGFGSACSQLGFDAVAAEETPHGSGNLMKEYSFGRACGGGVCLEGGDEIVELGLVVGVDDDILAGKPVLESVAGGGGFALLGCGAGRFLRIGAIRIDFTAGGWHEFGSFTWGSGRINGNSRR